MRRNPIRFVDLLQERAFVDRWGFLAFAFGGSVAIVAAKSLGIGASYVAIGAVIFLLVYAAVIRSGGTGKLRSDQAGDNCYYLGLIYTLASLAFAIFTFDPANTATTIVQGFGIALATTITGLILRVFFNQSRVDLYDAEDTARLELAEAAGRLKTELTQITLSFRDLGTEAQQSMSEIKQSATDRVEGTVQQAASAMENIVSSVSESLMGASKEYASKARSMGKATDKVVGALERHNEGFEQMAEVQAEAIANLRTINSASSAAQDAVETMLEQARTANEINVGTADAVGSLSDSMDRFESLIENVAQTFEKLDTEFANRLSELGGEPKAAIEASAEGIRSAEESFKRRLDELAAMHRSTGEELQDISSSVVEALRAHNREMDEELARSRENVNKVHSSLVELTGELIRTVERKAGDDAARS